MDRKDFLKTVSLGGVTFLGVCALDSCSSSAQKIDVTLDISQSPYTALQTNGSSVLYNTFIIARDNNGVFTVLDSACTHQGATVGFDSASKTFRCPRHGARFAFDGSVLNGPAQSPLQKYTAVLTGNSLHITS